VLRRGKLFLGGGAGCLQLGRVEMRKKKEKIGEDRFECEGIY
jgi:chromate transport protein ChrA